MSNSTAQLLKKGKRGAAAYIQADCASGSPQHLGPLLDVLLNPSKTIDEWEIVDWCRWLMAGGRTPDEFATVVRSYDKHDKCGLVWIPRVVAYRCRTCGISPCMSICRDCFHRGDHRTHDFNMFLSQAGGACDCGDNSVMKEDGFCSNHGNKCPRPGSAPAELMCVAEAMMPRLILRLLQHFRENSSQTNSDSYRIAVQECEGYVQMLMEFNNMGDLMRTAMTKALINPQMYRSLVEPPFPDTEFGRYMAESHNMYEKALDSFPAPEPPDEYRDLPALAPRVKHATLLDEFIFWTFKFEFPQNVVCFLLNMLPDQDYKEHLTRTFVLHYARIPLVLEAAADPDTLSNRVVHMSVQLFSNEALALRCVQQLHLLHVMVLSLRLMMNKILVRNTLHSPAHNHHRVIDCTRRVMKEHCYWPLVSDFNNVLSHRSVALLFLQDAALVDMWFHFLSMLQGMNVNVRETGSHIEFEPSSYYAAFSCELEAAAYPMWSVLGHLQQPAQRACAVRVLRAALAQLARWLRDVGLTPGAPPPDSAHASFHFPLHRYLAAFLCAGVRQLGLVAADVLPPPDQLALLALHPLRVQSLFYEILAGIWVRNGLQIKGQAMTYIQANFCNSMVDMDIYWLQICAGHMPADQYINMCIDMFGVREWLSMSNMTPVQAAEQDSMVEGLLTFLAIIVSSRSNLGNDELTQSRLEVSTLLAAGDKTHSQLLELMPERSGNAHTRNFETVLKELSTYRPPPKGSENLEQGLFVPKPIVWEQYYEPLHVLRRAVHRRDFHASMDRFTAYVREKQKNEGSSSSSGSGSGGGALWPPLRPPPPPPPGAPDPRAICSSGVLQACMLSVLHRAVHRRAPDSAPRAPPDHVVALCVFLLHTAADLQRPRHEDAPQHMEPTDPPPQPVEDQSVVCEPCWQVALHESRDQNAAQPSTSDGRTRLLCVYCRHSLFRTRYHTLETNTQRGRSINVVVASWLQPQQMEVCVPERWGAEGGSLLAALRGDVCSNAARHVRAVRRAAAAAPPAMYHSDSDTEWEPSESESSRMSPSVVGSLPANTSTALALTQLLPMARTISADEESDPGDVTHLRALEQGISQALAIPELTPVDIDLDERMLALTGLDIPMPTHADLEEEEWGVGSMAALPAPPAACPNPHTATNTQVQLHTESEDTVMINESIISLLMKLHSQLSARLDSFSLEEPPPPDQGPIGDGPYFIGKLLRKLAELDSRCATAIAQVRHTLWPHQREKQAEQRARERREKEERSRRARERQAAVMREFALRQEQFLANMLAQEGGDAALDEPSEHYTCVICSTCAPATAHEPLGLVALVQSTAVLGHRRRAGAEAAAGLAGAATLPLSEAQRAQLLAASAAHHHYRLHDDLANNFHEESWVVSVSVGWEGGVHAASCGHHIHLRCLAAYLRSLAAPQRPHNLQPERGEFLCPLCRQLANTALPLAPPPPRPPPLVSAPPQPVLAAHIQDMLDEHHPAPPLTRLSEAMGKAMEDMTATAGNKLKSRYGSSTAAVLTFICSLVRTNYECELVQRGGSLITQPAHPAPRYKPRNDCIVPLMVVAGAHACVLRYASNISETWRELCAGAVGAAGSAAAGAGGGTVAVRGDVRAVPMLLRDPAALLLLLLLLAPQHPPHMDIQHFTYIVRTLYTLNYYQVILQMIAGTTAEGRAALANRGGGGSGGGLVGAARVLLGALAGSDLFTEDGPPTTLDGHAPDILQMEGQLERLLLPFVRLSALIKSHVYDVEIPCIEQASDELPMLARFLDLDSNAMPWNSANALTENNEAAARHWAMQLAHEARSAQLAIRRIAVSLHVEWQQPRLLRLPREYDRLFSAYHERVCAACGAVPKEAAVCLLCGALVCLKAACCRRQHRAEAVQHAWECGGGTGVFLVVTSTYMVVIRGGRACLWGSLYLDHYDEEDRDLKRGKPLYLSEDRFELLEAQWLAHRFDHTKRTWVWHRDSL